MVSGWPSLKDFIGWTQDDPAGFTQWESVARRVESSELTDQTPELHAALATFVTFRKQMRALEVIRVKTRELIQVTEAAIKADPDGKLLARFKVLWDELADVMLDLPEPQRTQFFERLTPLHEKIRAVGRQQKD